MTACYSVLRTRILLQACSGLGALFLVYAGEIGAVRPYPRHLSIVVPLRFSSVHSDALLQGPIRDSAGFLRVNGSDFQRFRYPSAFKYGIHPQWSPFVLFLPPVSGLTRHQEGPILTLAASGERRCSLHASNRNNGVHSQAHPLSRISKHPRPSVVPLVFSPDSASRSCAG